MGLFQQRIMGHYFPGCSRGQGLLRHIGFSHASRARRADRLTDRFAPIQMAVLQFAFYCRPHALYRRAGRQADRHRSHLAETSLVFQSEGSRQNLAAFSKADGSPNYQAAILSSFYDDVITGTSKLHTIGMILSSPVISGNIVYVGSTDGNLYALE